MNVLILCLVSSDLKNKEILIYLNNLGENSCINQIYPRQAATISTSHTVSSLNIGIYIIYIKYYKLSKISMIRANGSDKLGNYFYFPGYC